MARLTRLCDGVECLLVARSLLGRGSACSHVIDDPFASSEHAKITWTGAQWTLKDLGSSNGTFVDGHRLTPGAPHVLDVGAEIGFGEPDAGWQLSDASGPSAVAIDIESKDVIAAVGDLLVVPGIDGAPDLTVFPDPQSARWVVENREGDAAPVDDMATVRTSDGRTFRLELPGIEDATPLATVAMTLENVDLQFAVSSDEERVDISVFLRGLETKLAAREHGYFLLTLARERRKDKEAGVLVSSRGWRTNEELHRMLRLDSAALRVSTHRVRAQFAEAGIENAASVVEVTRGKKRIGTERFRVTRLGADDE